MAAFVRVVECGGFARAASELGMSASAISKLVSRLETRLGVALLKRSTRKLALTQEGARFHERALSILAEIEEAESDAARAALPKGRIRVNSSASYVTHRLAPLLVEFLEMFPDVSLEIVETDALVDLVSERSDVAIRAGELTDSALLARFLGKTPLIAVASPAWIKANGKPRSPADLKGKDLVGFAYARRVGSWLPEGSFERVRISDGEGVRRLVLAGVGPARIAEFAIRDDLAEGRLVPLFPGDRDYPVEPFHVVYVGGTGKLPARVRVFLDYLAVEGRVD